MWPCRTIRELFGIEHPILLAPMAGTSTPELCAAVARAGGLAGYGLGTTTPEAVAKTAGRLKRATNGPVNLNFFVHPAPVPDAGRDTAARERARPLYARFGLDEPPEAAHDDRGGWVEGLAEAILAAAPCAVSFHFGLPPAAALAAWRAAGIRTMGTATTVDEARALEAAGVDAVVAQGWEAGGHRGVHRWRAPNDATGTMALVPQVVRAVDVPVIAAGGIASGAGIAAAFALGASGVQIGTAFAACPESAADPAWRRAAERGAPTVVSDQMSGFPARMARTAFAETMNEGACRPADYPSMYALFAPLREAARAAGSDDGEGLLMGQAAPLVRPEGAEALTARLVAETRTVLERLACGLSASP